LFKQRHDFRYRSLEPAVDQDVNLRRLRVRTAECRCDNGDGHQGLSHRIARIFIELDSPGTIAAVNESRSSFRGSAAQSEPAASRKPRLLMASALASLNPSHAILAAEMSDAFRHNGSKLYHRRAPFIEPS
jgi:hypothetical protein